MPTRRSIPPLRSLIAANETRRAKDETSALRAQLAQTVAALERARKVKPVKLTPVKRPKLKADTVRFIVPDTHGAKVSKSALSVALSACKGMGPSEVILLGDHVDCGGFLAQHHTLGYVAETAYSYEQDIAAANAMLDSVRVAAPNALIEYIEGNHERRVETWAVTQTLRHSRDADYLRRTFSPEFLLKLAERGIRYYRQGEFYDDLPVPGVIKRGSIYFFHGFSTASDASAATQRRVAGNCVFAHTHRQQAKVSRMMSTGAIGSWNPGCLCELQPLWQHTNPTDWTHGYAFQLISRTGKFLHINVPVLDDTDLLTGFISKDPCHRSAA